MGKLFYDYIIYKLTKIGYYTTMTIKYNNDTPQKEAINVLQECIELQLKKAQDYNNPNSRIQQAMYYPRGVATLLDIVWAKVLRMYSVVEAMDNDPNYEPNFESLEDSAKDLINYASFIVAYSRGGIEGQDTEKDYLNRKV